MRQIEAPQGFFTRIQRRVRTGPVYDLYIAVRTMEWRGKGEGTPLNEQRSEWPSAVELTHHIGHTPKIVAEYPQVLEEGAVSKLLPGDFQADERRILGGDQREISRIRNFLGKFTRQPKQRGQH